MNTNIQIKHNSYGFTGGQGKLDLTENGVEIEGVSLESQHWILRGGLEGLYLVLGVLLFLAAQWFIVIPNFGDIMKQWAGWFTEDPYIDVIRIINLVKMIFGFLLFIVLPLIGAFWLSDMIVNPIRLRFSTPKKIFIPYNELSWVQVTSDGDMDLHSVSKDSVDKSVIVGSQEISLPLNLLSHLISDYEGFSKYIGASLEMNDGGYDIKLQFFGYDYLIKDNLIYGPEEQHYKTASLIINYLFSSIFALKNNRSLVHNGRYVDVWRLDEDHFNMRLDTLSEDFKNNPALFNSVMLAIGGQEASASEKEKTYVVKALPNVSLLFKFEPKWTGGFKINLSFEESSYEFFGQEFIKSICDTALDLLKVGREEKAK